MKKVTKERLFIKDENKLLEICYLIWYVMVPVRYTAEETWWMHAMPFISAI